jgi:hypothetical protein
MTDGAKKSNHFEPESYPALMEFLPAYLHEDFGEEYGSAARAFAAMVSDANGDQIRNVKEEWTALRQVFLGKPLPDMQSALAQLGAAWRPQSEQELQVADEILRQAEA